MRPRPMTAENLQRRRRSGESGVASMRPRPMTAENLINGTPITTGSDGFNEAAADDRGKPLGRKAG